MSGPTKVIDTHANHEEVLERAAISLGTSKLRHLVFDQIYGRRRKPVNVVEVHQALYGEMSQQQVRDHLNYLANHSLINRVKEGANVSFSKIDHIATHKKQIKALALDKKKRDKLPTKRKKAVHVQGKSKTVVISKELSRARFVSIDEIENFSKARSASTVDMLGDELSEEQFKSGIQSILGEPGEFKDWGGEQSDLFTSRARFNGKRVRAAFAFKGPGLKGKLTIAKMGKNGDQCPRLFQEPADLFVVQHCREIDSAVYDIVEVHAQLKSTYENREVLFCLIDGKDSKKLVEAYPDHFK